MRAYPGLAAVNAHVSLETGRLRMRLPRESDLDAFAAIYADAASMQYLGDGKTLTRPETWRAITAMLGHWLVRGYGMFAVERKDTGAMIGRVGFLNPEGWPGFELGWTLAHEQRGNGFATEAARAALAYAFDTLDQARVISLIRPANAPSIRVAERLGQTLRSQSDLLGGPVLTYAIDRPAR